MEFFSYLWQYIKLATVMDVIDILIVAYLLYKLMKLIKETRAARLLKGILLLLIAMQLSDWLELNVVNFILLNTMQLGLLAIVIVFQPELRKMLEQVGRSRFSLFWDRESPPKDIEASIKQIVDACSSMSWSRIGAIIIIERSDKLSEIIKTGTVLDAEITSDLLKNIFYPKAPLHDGAAVLRGGRIVSAGCVLPLSDNRNLSRELGTRHRAAVGISEACNAVGIVVSEETGSISVAIQGVLKRHLSPETLEKLLLSELMPKNDIPSSKNLFMKWRDKKS